MFSKLAVRNVTRSLKDYSVYFLTLTFGVCIFYVFNSLDGQWAMKMLAQSAHYMVEAILTIINILSVFVSVVLACLILYANTFLIKRRKRELGTYFLLGLPTGKVSLLLVMETFLIGLLALVTGILLGVLLAQGLGLLTIAMFSVYPPGEDFGLVFSVGAVGKTALYFGVIFLLVMVFTGISVSRAKLIDLLEAGRKNEELRERPLWTSVLTFLAGVAMLLGAYAMLLIRGMLAMDALFFVMLGLGTLGTLLFFRSLSGFLLRVVKTRKKIYYKGLNMFVLRQFNSRIHTTYLSMTVICLLLLLAIGITATSVGLNNTIESITGKLAPFDLTVENYGGDREVLDIPALLQESGFDTDAMLRDSHSYILYYNDGEITGNSEAQAAISLGDYNALLKLRGLPSIALDAPAAMAEPLVNGNLNLGDYLVVPDSMAERLPVRRQIFVADYREGLSTKELFSEENAAENGVSGTGDLQIVSRLSIYSETMGSKILVLFLGLYLGMVFLLAAAAVLALQQLSQAADNAPRYRVLSRLGASEKMRTKAVFTQVALAFFLHLALAVVHSAVGMTAANQVIAMVGRVDTVASSVVTAAVILVIYGAYFLATYFGSRRILREK